MGTRSIAAIESVAKKCVDLILLLEPEQQDEAVMLIELMLPFVREGKTKFFAEFVKEMEKLAKHDGPIPAP